MALKDEASPKYAFPEAGMVRKLSVFFLFKSCWLLLAAALLPLLFLLLLLLLGALLPLLLPRPLLWLLLQLPAAKHHGPKGRSESKIYVSRGRNVPSEILQKACCWCGNISFYLFKSCWLLLAAALLPLLLLLLLLLDSLLPLLLPRPLLWLLLQLPAAKHMALKDEASPKSAHTALAVKACLLGGNSNTKCSMTFVNIAVAISALAGGGGGPKTVSHRDQTPKTVSHRDQNTVVFSSFFGCLSARGY